MAVESYEGSSVDSIREQIATLEAELADLKKQLEKKGSTYGEEATPDTSGSTTGSVFSGSGPEIVVQSVSRSVVDKVRLYRWGNETITKDEVMNIINGLKEPYNSEVSEFVEKNDIKGLQKYLNSKIDSGDIDLNGLRAALKARNIPLKGNNILEDGKFGPQTLETIRFFVREQGKEDPKKPEPVKPTPPTDRNPKKPIETPEKMKGNLDWIIQEMADEISGIVTTKPSKRWSPERLVLDTENFKVDTKNKTITIETRGTSLNSPERAHNPNNRCEYNWATGQIFAYVGKRRYTMPIKLQALRLDSAGLPDGKQMRNRQVVEAFARVGNLMNNLKAHGVFNQRGALEEDSGGIEVNNGVMGVKDTQLISGGALSSLRSNYSHVGVKFNTVEIAGMLTAMKLDLGKIKWTPDIESGSWMRKNPLDEEHIRYVKRYSQTYGR